MKFLKKIGFAAAIALATGAAQANPVMNDWTFNPAGTGLAKGQEINEYLDVNGKSFIQLFPTSATSFNFVEHATFNISQADGNGQLFPVNYGGVISATLEAYGTGSFNGNIRFTGGTIKMYHNPTYGQYGTSAGFYGANIGPVIAEFEVLVGGGGKVDGRGIPTDNGQVSIDARANAGKIAPGYFFDDKGADMSTQSRLAFAFTNANTTAAPDAVMLQEIACQFAGFTGDGCNGKAYSNTPGAHFFIGGNGQFKFAEVPEPGSVALFGIALFGIGALRRRVK